LGRPGVGGSKKKYVVSTKDTKVQKIRKVREVPEVPETSTIMEYHPDNPYTRTG